MLAKIQGLFRLTRDAELIYAQSGSAILKLGLACSEKYKEKETQLFIDAVAFGKAGELISQYSGQKGKQIFLTGKLQTEKWVDNASGQNRSKVSMVIEDFSFVSDGSNANQGQPQQSYQQQQQPQYYQQQQQQNNGIPVENVNANGQSTGYQNYQPQQPQQPNYQQQQQNQHRSMP